MSNLFFFVPFCEALNSHYVCGPNKLLGKDGIWPFYIHKSFFYALSSSKISNIDSNGQ